MPDSSSPRQESSAELKVSSGEIVSSYNLHTPALPCFPQQQRLLSHLKGSTALVHIENASLARDGAHQAVASALNQASPPSAVNEGRQIPLEGQFTDLRYLWHRMNHQGSAHLYPSLAPGQPKPDTLRPLLHLCSSFSQG